MRWLDCLMASTELLHHKQLSVPLSDAVPHFLVQLGSELEAAQPLSKLCLEFPDLYIEKGVYCLLINGPLIFTIQGKAQASVGAAAAALSKNLHSLRSTDRWNTVTPVERSC